MTFQTSMQDLQREVYNKLLDSSTTPIPVVSSSLVEQLLLDKASDTVTYVGVAARGTATSAAAWKIFKLDTTSGLSKKWASGAYDQVWDNRASLTYS